ncbi:MAG: DUF4363 family protein [Oscillospiraceae bacterium]|jgi:hypothetical protein|nr:DUF4363 family protein [Oscillospiraceae bacterium]
MKKIGITLTIFVLTFFLCLASFIFVEKTAQYTENYLEEIEKSNDKKEFEMALEKCKELNSFWDERSKILSVFIHHDTLDKINQSLKVINVSLKNKSRIETSKAKVSAMAYIKALKESDEISIENIF